MIDEFMQHADKVLVCVQREASSSKKARKQDEESGLPSNSEAETAGQEEIEQGLSSRGASFGDHNAAHAFTTAVRSVV